MIYCDLVSRSLTESLVESFEGELLLDDVELVGGVPDVTIDVTIRSRRRLRLENLRLEDLHSDGVVRIVDCVVENASVSSAKIENSIVNNLVVGRSSTVNGCVINDLTVRDESVFSSNTIDGDVEIETEKPVTFVGNRFSRLVEIDPRHRSLFVANRFNDGPYLL